MSSSVDIAKLLDDKLSEYLVSEFTGQISFHLHCRKGGVGRIFLEVKQNFGKDDFTDKCED